MTGEDDEAWPPEPGPEVYELGPLRMERAHGCFRDLTWRVTGHEAFDPGTFSRRFVEAGLEDRSRSPLVREFVSSEGDVLIFIPKTRRLELRIWAARPYPERGPAAAHMLEGLARAIEQARN
ncbi:MAG: hypothetical protein GXP55_09305 [Deltaproteobacteria bacterium]|nr:hypothetical protein [Deltaproteobacteria bacterium]